MSSPTPQTVTLRSALDLAAAAPLRAELLALRGAPVLLDGTQVERLGGLCLQVLLSAERTWRKDHCDFALLQPSAAFAAALTSLGARNTLPIRGAI